MRLDAELNSVEPVQYCFFFWFRCSTYQNWWEANSSCQAFYHNKNLDLRFCVSDHWHNWKTNHVWFPLHKMIFHSQRKLPGNVIKGNLPSGFVSFMCQSRQFQPLCSKTMWMFVSRCCIISCVLQSRGLLQLEKSPIDRKWLYVINPNSFVWKHECHRFLLKYWLKQIFSYLTPNWNSPQPDTFWSMTSIFSKVWNRLSRFAAVNRCQ